MVKVTSKELKNTFVCFRAPYCSLHYLLRDQGENFANYGVYGWNYSAFIFNNHWCITTGYRETIGRKIPDEMINKYELQAKQAKTDELKAIQDAFLKELIDWNYKQWAAERGLE